MDPSTRLPADETAGSSPEVEAPKALARLRAHPQPLLVAAGAFVVLALLLVGVDLATSSPALCTGCHEMGLRAAAWKVSPHAKVKCVECHVASHPWYAFPETLYGRGRFLSRVVAKHFTAAPPEAVDSRPAGVPRMSDAVCLRCHDPNRKATSGYGILIKHAAHAKRNGSCVSCHITVAHPTPSRGTALSFMAQCFACHGTPKTPKASAACRLCHPADFRPLPASHDDERWKRGHGRVGVVDPRQCQMCHVKSFCSGCHGLTMPHPKDWAQRTGHPVYAKQERQVCTKCHENKPDWCSMCHHKAYDPAKGTWVKQHFLVVQAKGAYFCLEACHSPVYCSRCHVGSVAAKPDGGT